MKIVTYNINGIRASMRQGLNDFIQGEDADIFCFQEVRASEGIARQTLGLDAQQIDLFGQAEPSLGKFNYVFNCGQVAGYAGTLTMTKRAPDKVILGMPEFWEDNEGRVTTIVLNELAVVNVYVPNGNSRLDFKMQFLAALEKFLAELMKKYDVIIVGDFNIAHERIDLTHPDECQNKSVFLPIEREAFSRLLGVGLVDTFRHLNPDAKEYTWQRYRLNSGYENSSSNWKYRIDYVLASVGLAERMKSCKIVWQRCSDHIPVIFEMDI